MHINTCKLKIIRKYRVQMYLEMMNEHEHK